MVYLIHFEEKLSRAQHYIGYSRDDLFQKRIKHHQKGTGSRLLRAVNLAGIKWKVARTWPEQDGNFERRLKNQKKAARLCPICRMKGE